MARPIDDLGAGSPIAGALGPGHRDKQGARVAAGCDRGDAPRGGHSAEPIVVDDRRARGVERSPVGPPGKATATSTAGDAAAARRPAVNIGPRLST